MKYLQQPLLNSVSLLLVLVAVVQQSTAANIVLLLFPAFSHIAGPANVAKVLQDQGHNVKMAIPRQLEQKLKGRGVNLLMYDSLNDLNVHEEMDRIVSEGFLERPFLDIAYDVRYMMEAMSDKILKDQQLVEDIRGHKTDLMILDSTPGARMFAIIPYKLDIPFMFFGTEVEPPFARTPLLYSVVPNKFLFEITDQMTFAQRLFNTLIGLMLCFSDYNAFPSTKAYAPEKPDISLQDLHAKALLWIIKDDSVLGYSTPGMPNVKFISHMYMASTPKLLPQELQVLMDNANEGVIIVSFGSLFRSIPPVIQVKLLTAFKKIEVSKVFIMNPMSNSSDSDKLIFKKWIPELNLASLLRHRNARLFITHCGSNSVQEAVLAGIPMIGFPIFGDQKHYAGRIVRKGFGLKMDLKTFSVDELVNGINEILTNTEYKNRTQKASAIMQSRIVQPVQEAVFWINHVLTFGADHLKSVGQDMPLWKFFGWDVLAFLALAGHIFIFIFIKILCFCSSCCVKGKEKMKEQ